MLNYDGSQVVLCWDTGPDELTGVGSAAGVNAVDGNRGAVSVLSVPLSGVGLLCVFDCLT